MKNKNLIEKEKMLMDMMSLFPQEVLDASMKVIKQSMTEEDIPFTEKNVHIALRLLRIQEAFKNIAGNFPRIPHELAYNDINKIKIIGNIYENKNTLPL